MANQASNPVRRFRRGQARQFRHLSGVRLMAGQARNLAARCRLEQAKRYLLTGDEIPATEAARIGLILEAVPDGELQEHAAALAGRMARLPLNQLQMLKLLCNQTAESMGMASSRTLGTLFDGIARHTQEGIDFVARSGEIGFRDAVRERDDPFGDYGSGPRSKRR